MAETTSTPPGAGRRRTGSAKRKGRKKPNPGKVGRPSKIDTAKAAVDHFLQLIASGNFGKVAAEKAGISYDTVLRWVRRAEDGDAAFRDFAERYARANAEAETAMVGLVWEGAKVDPNHAKWFLEHRYPDRWNRRTVDVTGVSMGEASAPRDLSAYTTEELAKLREIEVARAQREAAAKERG